MTAWILLIVAGLLEVGWAIGLKYSAGFTRPLANTLTLVALGASFYLLSQALRTIPVGTGYAIWTGIGAAGTAILGMYLFDEPRNAGRLVCLGLIVVGIVGLKYFSPPAG